MRRLLPALLLIVQGLTCVAGAAAVTHTSSARRHATHAIGGQVVSALSVVPPVRARRVPRPHKRVHRVLPALPRDVRRHRAAVTQHSVVRPRVPAPIVRHVVVLAPLTVQQELNAAVARIPGHADPKTAWVLTTAYGSWGTADWYRNVVYISPTVPTNRMYDVVIHEYSHLQSVAPYDGQVDAAMSAMNGYFGGSGLTGAERAADCMALLQGATWTHYTPCTDAHWRDGARRLLQGEKL